MNTLTRLQASVEVCFLCLKKERHSGHVIKKTTDIFAIPAKQLLISYPQN